MKKDCGFLDVAMGVLDGTEMCKLVGNILFHKLFKKYERKNLAL